MLSLMPPKRTESKETVYIRHLIDEGQKEFGGNMSAFHRWLAPRGEIKRPHLINVQEGDRGVGIDLMSIFAAKYHDGSLDELRRAAADYAGRASQQSDRDVLSKGQLSTLRWAEENGFSERTLSLVSSLRLADETNDSRGRFWIDIVDYVERHGALPPYVVRNETPRELPAGQTLPKDWRGFDDAANAILCDLKKSHEYSPYYGAVMWFSATPTSKRPVTDPLSVAELLSFVRDFWALHKNDTEMSDWQDRAIAYHREKTRRAKTKRTPSFRPQAPPTHPIKKTR